MKLYKLITPLGEYYVIAHHPTEAEEKLLAKLNDSDYGDFHYRQVTSINYIASSSNDKTLIGKYLIL